MTAAPSGAAVFSFSGQGFLPQGHKYKGFGETSVSWLWFISIVPGPGHGTTVPE